MNACKNSIRSLTDKEIVRHVGDVEDFGGWWESSSRLTPFVFFEVSLRSTSLILAELERRIEDLTGVTSGTEIDARS